jgi:hypothetical protein
MNKLIIMLIAGMFAGAGAAQTGVVSPASVADHGTPAMHAQESAQNLAKSKATQGLSGDQVRRQAVADTTKVADHGTPTLHAQDAVKNVTASKAQPASIGGSKSGQEAVQQATKGTTR